MKNTQTADSDAKNGQKERSSLSKVSTTSSKRTDSAFNTVALHVAKVPLTLSDLLDEDAEGVFDDCQVDTTSEATLDWSDEAHALKELKYEKDRKAKLRVNTKLAEVNKQLQELVLRGQASASSLNSAKEMMQNASDSARGTFTEDFLYDYFETLRLVNLGIGAIDPATLKFKNIKELSLTGNLISQIANLPEELQILHVNANWITELA
ncbi:Leucine-rich repeat-containing protein 43 [Phlyctochytrium planicorne]|nr:Leucine-rich repeat-containing protein 43 [Phlyctochytrium planicorne]